MVAFVVTSVDVIVDFPFTSPFNILSGYRTKHCTHSARAKGTSFLDPSVAPAWLLKGRGWVSLTSGSIVGTSECEMNE